MAGIQYVSNISQEKEKNQSSYYASSTYTSTSSTASKPSSSTYTSTSYKTNSTNSRSRDEYMITDPEDYDNPDDFADAWGLDFDDAYDYWENY